MENIRPILSALQYLLNNGIVHKDVKPSNIMIDGHSCVKLMDLGVANTLQDSRPGPGIYRDPAIRRPGKFPTSTARSGSMAGSTSIPSA